jgi:signal transduction histidine kinase
VKDERALEMVDSQQHSLTAMTNLLNSLLDISRLDAGAVTPELEEFPIRRLPTNRHARRSTMVSSFQHRPVEP